MLMYCKAFISSCRQGLAGVSTIQGSSLSCRRGQDCLTEVKQLEHVIQTKATSSQEDGDAGWHNRTRKLIHKLLAGRRAVCWAGHQSFHNRCRRQCCAVQ